MTAHTFPASGRGDGGFLQPQAGSHRAVTSNRTVTSDRDMTSNRDMTSEDAVTSHVVGGLRARPGESNPARMLAGVLVLVIATVIMVLPLVWWLA